MVCVCIGYDEACIGVLWSFGGCHQLTVDVVLHWWYVICECLVCCWVCVCMVCVCCGMVIVLYVKMPSSPTLTILPCTCICDVSIHLFSASYMCMYRSGSSSAL